MPLAVEFPFPAWATRLSEAGDPRAGRARPTGDPLSHEPFAAALTRGDDPPPF